MYPDSRTIVNTLLTALTPVLWGSTYIVTTEWLPEGRPFMAACIRTLPAGLVLVAWSGIPIPARKDWARMAVLSWLNIGLFQALLFVAAYRLPGGVAAVVGATQPMLVLALSWVLDGNRPGTSAIAAAATSIGGMAWIFASPHEPWDLLGLLAAGGATFCMGLGTVLASRWRVGLPLLAFTGWQLVAGGLFLAPLALLLEPPLRGLGAVEIAGFGYLSIGGALIGYTLWFRGISRLPPSAVSALGLLSPLTAIVLGWSLLGESISLRQAGGMWVVLGAVFILQLSRRPARDTGRAATRSIHSSTTIQTTSTP